LLSRRKRSGAPRLACRRRAREKARTRTRLGTCRAAARRRTGPERDSRGVRTSTGRRDRDRAAASRAAVGGSRTSHATNARHGRKSRLVHRLHLRRGRGRARRARLARTRRARVFSARQRLLRRCGPGTVSMRSCLRTRDRNSDRRPDEPVHLTRASYAKKRTAPPTRGVRLWCDHPCRAVISGEPTVAKAFGKHLGDEVVEESFADESLG